MRRFTFIIKPDFGRSGCKPSSLLIVRDEHGVIKFADFGDEWDWLMDKLKHSSSNPDCFI